MAEFRQRVSQNVVGKFYVDWTCIYCGICVETAPTVFGKWDADFWAFVHTQPATLAENALVMEAVDACPTQSIGFDGERCDWSAVPPEQETLMNSSTGTKRVRDQIAPMIARQAALNQSLELTPESETPSDGQLPRHP